MTDSTVLPPDDAQAAAVVDDRPDEGALGAARTADVLIDLLIEHGVEVIFGIPGGTIAPLYDALLDRPQVRVITTRHETGAMYAAAGYARTTGKLGVVMVTSGPGVLNCFNGLASAYLEGLPVLLLAGEVPRKVQGRRALQEGSSHNLNIVGMMRSITKLAFEIPESNAAPTMLQRGIATALSGKKGPVAITLPLDVTSAEIVPPEIAVDVHTTFTVSEKAVSRARYLLTRYPRVAIFVGARVREGHGPQALRAFAEHTQIPVMTTPRGKGVFPEDHPLALGVFGMGGHPSSSDFLKEGLDVLLVLGTGLGDLATDGWSELLQPKYGLIHVDLDAAHVGRTYATALSIAAPADQFLDRLREQMPAAAEQRTYGIRYYTDPEQLAVGDEGKITPQRALWELQQVLPADTIYALDAGDHYGFAVHYIKSTSPDAFVAMTGMGSMGCAIGSAMGAKLAHPERTVVAICGDGGLAMQMGELLTIATEKIDILVVVLNDGRFTMVERGNVEALGRTPPYPTGPMSVLALGQALGLAATRIARPGDMQQRLFAHAGAGPLVAEVDIDASVHMPKHGRGEQLARLARPVKPEKLHPQLRLVKVA